MSQDKSENEGGLQKQYQNYNRQKCFVAYSEQTDWSEDLLSACEEVVSQAPFNLELDYARKHFASDVTLREKALELIANSRCGIYDFSYWQNSSGEWQIPRNVLIELGIAIALNRPTLLLRHANNSLLELPECLKGLSGYILEFSGYTTLKRRLKEKDALYWLRYCLQSLPELSWLNRRCIFGQQVCDYRAIHPRGKQLEQNKLSCCISDSQEVDRLDFRGVIEDVMERFNDVTYTYMDELCIKDGYKFLLCSHCQTLRSNCFAIYRITPNSPPETFISIGISIALEKQFNYKIPKILIAENLRDVPSLLSGYEVVIARSDRERKDALQKFIPAVIDKVRDTIWNPQPLPFELTQLIEETDENDETRYVFDSDKPIFITDSNFKEEVLDSYIPVLVDFWAPWCGPCRMVSPVVDEIAAQYAGQLKVVKINTDENPNGASEYGVRSIPTLMLFKGGQKVDMIVGAVPKTTLANWLEKYL